MEKAKREANRLIKSCYLIINSTENQEYWPQYYENIFESTPQQLPVEWFVTGKS